MDCVKVQEKKKKVVVFLVPVFKKLEIRLFHVIVVQQRGKEMYKKA